MSIFDEIQIQISCDIPHVTIIFLGCVSIQPPHVALMHFGCTNEMTIHV